MTKSRMTVLGAVAAFALLLVGGAGPAAAQTPSTPFTKVVKMTATAKNGTKFTGTYTISRFTQRSGKVYAVGTLKGRLKGRSVRRASVKIPVTTTRRQAAGAAQIPGAPPNPTPGACQILDLELRPIFLNLLGLQLQTSRIELLLEAVPGANALLGNLLCAITGILDPQTATPSQLAQVLNALLALVPRTA